MDRDDPRLAGQWLREQRERRGLTVRQLAGRLDVATQVIYDWQNGKNRVSDDNAARLAEILGLPELEARRHLGLWVPEPTGRYSVEERTVQGPVGETVAYIVRDLEADTDGMSEEESEEMLTAVLEDLQRQARVAVERERARLERERRRRGDA